MEIAVSEVSLYLDRWAGALSHREPLIRAIVLLNGSRFIAVFVHIGTEKNGFVGFASQDSHPGR